MSSRTQVKGRVLIVAPVSMGTGETVNALNAGNGLAGRGYDTLFLASPRASRIITSASMLPVVPLAGTRGENWDRIREALRSFRPGVVLFADWPLLFISASSVSTGRPADWLELMSESGIACATFDCMGLARLRESIRFGLGSVSNEVTPATLPDEMRIVLPVPLYEPYPPQADEEGIYRALAHQPSPMDPSLRRLLRSQLLPDDSMFVILHAIPLWAQVLSEHLRTSFYKILYSLIADNVPARALLISVTADASVTWGERGQMHVRRLNPVSPPAFEGLLHVSDVFVTDNACSTSLAKAVMMGRPSIVVQCTGDADGIVAEDHVSLAADAVGAMEASKPIILPFRVFPLLSQSEGSKLPLLRDNWGARPWHDVDLRRPVQLQDALADTASADSMRNARAAFASAAQSLPDAANVVAELL